MIRCIIYCCALVSYAAAYVVADTNETDDLCKVYKKRNYTDLCVIESPTGMMKEYCKKYHKILTSDKWLNACDNNDAVGETADEDSGILTDEHFCKSLADGFGEFDYVNSCVVNSPNGFWKSYCTKYYDVVIMGNWSSVCDNSSPSQVDISTDSNSNSTNDSIENRGGDGEEVVTEGSNNLINDEYFCKSYKDLMGKFNFTQACTTNTPTGLMKEYCKKYYNIVNLGTLNLVCGDFDKDGEGEPINVESNENPPVSANSSTVIQEHFCKSLKYMVENFNFTVSCVLSSPTGMTKEYCNMYYDIVVLKKWGTLCGDYHFEDAPDNDDEDLSNNGESVSDYQTRDEHQKEQQLKELEKCEKKTTLQNKLHPLLIAVVAALTSTTLT